MSALKVVAVFQDDSGEISSTEIKIPITVDPGEWVSFGVAAVTLVATLSTAALRTVSIVYEIPISNFAGSLQIATATSDVEEKGYFSFLTVNGYPTKLSIPALNETLVLAGTDSIDQTDTDVAAFISMMTNGITPNATLIEPCDSRGEDIIDVVIAEERFVSRR